MSTCLRKFYDANGCPPQRIIFYRDGVAHNQFDIVMTQVRARARTRARARVRKRGGLGLAHYEKGRIRVSAR